MKIINGISREIIIREFRKKISDNGLTIAGFARKNGIRPAVFYVRLYDERGLYGKVRDLMLDYILER